MSHSYLIRRAMTLLTLLLISSSGVAQPDEFQRWRAQTQGQFQAYLDANDKAFMDFLKQQWREVELEPERKLDPEPKPVVIPQAPEPKPEPAPIPEPTPEPETRPEQTPPPPTVPTPSIDRNLSQVKLTFYGHDLTIPYDRKMVTVYRGRPNGDNIANYWQSLATTNHSATLKTLRDIQQALTLNDWAMALLVDQFSRSLHRDHNSRTLTNWFLLVKSGYDARLAYNDHIHLLMPSEQTLYGTTFFRLQQRTYYALNLHDNRTLSGRVYTYDEQHENAQQALNFTDAGVFHASGKRMQRQLSFQDNGQTMTLTIDYPKAAVDYLNQYPQMDLPKYFRADLDPSVAQPLLQQMRPWLAGLETEAAVNRLLRFVQTAFEYQTDDQQFGRENYLFPLETLHYPYSDCEDRAALFAWLVRELLQLDVVILDYPGHIATAVALPKSINGDKIRHQGRDFWVADPTYVYANIGMTMPQYQSLTPNVIAY
ncbi:MAG: hypothetical protein IBX52_09190 [Bacterioplanes sp.]|nr:hypothetical protein [Bacterioplanes sp.]